MLLVRAALEAEGPMCRRAVGLGGISISIQLVSDGAPSPTIVQAPLFHTHPLGGTVSQPDHDNDKTTNYTLFHD